MTLPRTISFRATVKWPASFTGTQGVEVGRDGAGAWTASLDVSSLTIDNAPDINTDYVPYWDASADTHKRATLVSLAAGGYTGLEFNTRLAKTANYTLLNTDKGKTLALGGTALFTLTIGVASGFDADFIVRIVNEDNIRAKRITPDGITSFLLWPHQTMHLYNQNNVWQVDRPAYANTNLLGSNILNVDEALGDDDNDGMATSGNGPLLTIQRAVNIIQDEWLGGGSIQLADGTFTAGANITGSLHGQTTIAIIGNPISPGNCIIQVGASAICFNVQDHAGLSLSGMRLVSTGAGAIGIGARQFSIVDFGDIQFSTMSGGTHISLEDNSVASAIAGYNIIGDAAVHISASRNCMVNIPQTVTMNVARAFTTFAALNYESELIGAPTFSGAGVAGTTGTKFTVLNYSRIDTTVTYPGNVAGTSNPVFGTTTNDAAITGYLGEYGQAALARGSAVALTTTTAKTVTSISLPAGDLEVWGHVVFLGNAATTVTIMRGSISTTTDTEDSTVLNQGQIHGGGATVLNNADVGVRAGPIRVSLSAATTYYLVALATFAVSTCSAYGTIAYRRVR